MFEWFSINISIFCEDYLPTLVTLFSAHRDVLRSELFSSRCEHKKVVEKLYKVELFVNQLQHYFSISVAREQDPRWRMKLYFY